MGTKDNSSNYTNESVDAMIDELLKKKQSLDKTIRELCVIGKKYHSVRAYNIASVNCSNQKKYYAALQRIRRFLHRLS